MMMVVLVVVGGILNYITSLSPLYYIIGVHTIIHFNIRGSFYVD